MIRALCFRTRSTPLISQLNRVSAASPQIQLSRRTPWKVRFKLDACEMHFTVSVRFATAVDPVG